LFLDDRLPLPGERRLRLSNMAREYVWLECTETGLRTHRTQKETRGTERLELSKYNKKLRRHTKHKESRKK
jgi:large subunit ribosomal protein L33